MLTVKNKLGSFGAAYRRITGGKIITGKFTANCRQMTIGKKIFGSFLIVIILVFLMSIFTYIKVGELNVASQETRKKSLAEIQLAEELAIDVTNEAVAMLRFNFTGDLADAAAFDGYRKFADSKINQLESVLSADESRAILKDVRREKAEFDAIAINSIEAKRRNNIEQVGIDMQQAAKPSANLIDATKRLVSTVQEYIRDQEEEITRQSGQVQLILVVVSILVAVIAIIVSIYISRGVSKPVGLIAEAAAKISDGNLAVADITVKSSDELGQLANSFNKMKSNLRDIIQQFAHSAERMAASSEQLTSVADQSAQAGNQVAGATVNVAQGAAMQLITINDTVIAVQQMSESTRQIAVSAGTVADRSEQTSLTASAGATVIEQVINQMAQIEQTVNAASEVVVKLGDRSREIGQIVATISAIAGQTNLLALNAAIEAARAGEQGRGFAVVAEEVRKLAEQSHEAAKQIAGLIGEIQGDTNQAVTAITSGTREAKSGAEIVDAAGKAFQDIAGLVSEVSSRVNDISVAIQQMAGGSEKIVASVEEINSFSKKVSDEAQTVSAATEEQSASIEEIAASSQTLSEMARDLQEAISKFRF